MSRVAEGPNDDLLEGVLAGDRAAIGRAITLVESSRADHRADARALLAERIGLKPKNPHAWRRYAEALELAGDATAAKTARQRCSTLLSA